MKNTKTIYLVDEYNRMLIRQALESAILDARIIEIIDGKDFLELLS